MAHVEPATDVHGRPADRLLRLPEHEQADPAAARGVRVAAPRACPERGCCSSARAGERFDLVAPARAARARPTASTALDYVPEERMWSLMAACDVLVNLRYPTMGETSGSVIRGLSLGKPLRRLRRRLVRRAARRRRAEGPGRRATRCATLEAALGFAADHAGELGAAARAYVEREHDLAARRRRLRRGARASPPAATRSNDAVLWRIAEAAAEVGHRRRRRRSPARRVESGIVA